MSTPKKLADLYMESVIWNLETLKENTLEMQLKKVEEEILEGKEASEKGEDQMEEIADVFIATAGVGRFDKDLSLHIMINVLSGLPCTYEELANAVEKKLAVLRERTYEIINGVYRHPTIQ